MVALDGVQVLVHAFLFNQNIIIMNRVVEVYKHYKSLNGSMLLLFRVRNNYEAYFDDATSISTILNVQLHTEEVGNIVISKVVLPASDILDLVGDLGNYNIQCKLIQQRNQAGDFDLPDVELLKKEQELDY